MIWEGSNNDFLKLKKKQHFRKDEEHNSSRYEVPSLWRTISSYFQSFCAVLLMIPIPGREYVLGLIRITYSDLPKEIWAVWIGGPTGTASSEGQCG